MIHARLIFASLICMGVCLSLAGCGSVTKARYEKIVADGTTNLAAAEAVMGAKGMEVPKDDWKKFSIGPKAFPKGKEAEGKLFRWGNEDRFIIVGVVEDKVMFKGMSQKAGD